MNLYQLALIKHRRNKHCNFSRIFKCKIRMKIKSVRKSSKKTGNLASLNKINITAFISGSMKSAMLCPSHNSGIISYFWSSGIT